MLLTIRGFVNSYPKAKNIKHQKKSILKSLAKKYKVVLIIEKVSNDKGIHKKDFFRMERLSYFIRR